MAKIVNVQLFFADAEWRIVERTGMDIVACCRENIRQELRDRMEAHQIIESPASLSREILSLRQECEMLRAVALKKTVGCEVRVPAAELLKNL